ncbi:MAG: PIN domain-containing protein [Candidatus Hydrogenedentota bacterium]
MDVLVDTTIWSAALRRDTRTRNGAVDELQALIVQGRARIMGPIRQELLSGIRSERQFDEVGRYLAPFPDLILNSDDFITAASYFNKCRAHGVQGSGVDYLICSVAHRNGLSIFTTDKDFERFAKHLPIILHATG